MKYDFRCDMHWTALNESEFHQSIIMAMNKRFDQSYLNKEKQHFNLYGLIIRTGKVLI